MKKVIEREDCLLFGHLRKVQGIRGELRLAAERELKTDLPAPVFIFLDLDGDLVPFRLESMAEKGVSAFVVKMADIDNPSLAERYVNVAVFLPRECFETGDDNLQKAVSLIGYVIIDRSTRWQGRVVRVISSTVQEILVVADGEKEVMIPFAEGLIVKADLRRRQLTLDLPEGLLDLNL